MTFSGVTVENWSPTIWRYVASFAKAFTSTAVPMRSFVCAASWRNVAVVGAGPLDLAAALAAAGTTAVGVAIALAVSVTVAVTATAAATGRPVEIRLLRS